MLQTLVRNGTVLIGCAIVAVLLLTAHVTAVGSELPPAQPVLVQGQPDGVPVHLSVAFRQNALVGTVTVSDKDGRPWLDVRGQAYLLDSTGQRLAVIPLQPLAPGEFRLIAPLGRLGAHGYLDVRLPGRGQIGEQRGVYEVDPIGRSVTWTQAAPGDSAALFIQATGGPDVFGYTWDDTAGYGWIDTSGGVSVSLRDDDYIGPLPIGFTFSFYGKNYNQFYLDSNGFLSFADNGQSYYNYSKYSLPSPARPNNIIAPFWEDFDPSRGGAIRYKTIGSAPNRALVVEWQGVKLYGDTGTQSVQAVLYEGSNQIRFEYPNTRSGARGNLTLATVGIENDDGTIGITYPYTIPVGTNRAVLFSYIQPAYNVFLTPDQQGDSAAAGSSAAFHVLVKNLGANFDAYTMSRAAYSGADWAVSFYHSDGVTPLAGNSTGVIAAGAQKDIVVKVSVPGGASVGSWTRSTAKATSQASGAVQSTAAMDVMRAPSFYQVYTDNDSSDGTEDSENYVHPVVDGASHPRRLTTDQDNSNYAGTATTPDGNAVTVWNTKYWNGRAWVSEIQYAVVDRSGSLRRSIARVTDNSAAAQKTYDFSPAVAVAPNGNILIDWARQVDTDGDGSLDRYNAWYTLVSGNGDVVKAPTALTNNTSDYPRDYPPSVTALAGGNFLLTWEHAAASGGAVDTYYAVLNSSGNVVKSATRLTDGAGTNVTPRAASFPNGRAAIVWTSYNSYDNGEIYYAVLNADGTSPSPLTPITTNGDSASSHYADAAALSDGQLAVAWTQATTDLQIQYAIVTGDPVPGPTLTPSPTSSPTPSPTSSPTPTNTPSPGPVPQDGHWTGTTSRSHPMSFDVSSGGTTWSNFVLRTDGVVGPCSVTITTTVPGPGAIANGQFSFSGSYFAFSGQFTSSSAASGSYAYTNYNIPGCGYFSQAGTWTATPALPSSGIYGRVTYQGSPVAGVYLALWFYNGSSWSTVLTTATQADGSYRFTGVPGLATGQRYYVRYNNGSDGNPSNPSYLAAWYSFDITTYTAGANVAGGDFDIANIALSSPAPGATVSLPQAFSWVRRTATTSDDYEWDLFDPADMNPWVYFGPLGYVSDFTLNSLPSGFTFGTPYGWNVWVNASDGGSGVSYYYRTVTFSGGGTGLRGALDVDRPVNRADLNRLVEARRASAPAALAFQNPLEAQAIHTVPNALSNANIFVSLAVDANDPTVATDDRLIMTWLDDANAYYLFYALASGAGSDLTPATILQRTRHSYLWSSWNGYGNDRMPPKPDSAPGVKVYLPAVVKNYMASPPPQPVRNGGLEDGDLQYWTAGGDAGLSPRKVTSQHHGGSYAAVLGQEIAPCQSGSGGRVGQSWMYQDFAVPNTGSAQLTFYYRIFTYDLVNADKFDRFEVYLNGTLLNRLGNTMPGNYGCSKPINDLGWRLFTSDLSAYRGQTIRLRLVNVTHPDDWFGTWTYIDDVSVN